MIAKVVFFLLFFTIIISLAGQDVGIVHIDSIATYSIIEDSSFIFCNEINNIYLKKGKILVDSLNYKYKQILKDIQSTYPQSYFDKKHKEIEALQQTVLRLEQTYNRVQSIVNEAIYEFTIQQTQQHSSTIGKQLQLKYIIITPPIFIDFAKIQSKEPIKNVTQELIKMINTSNSFNKDWFLFKQELKKEIKSIE